MPITRRCWPGSPLLFPIIFDARKQVMANQISRAPRQALQVLRADMDSIVELQIYSRHHPGIRNLTLRSKLRHLNAIPFRCVALVDMPSDLDIVKRKIGLLEIFANCLHEVLEFLEELARSFCVAIVLALVPQDAFDSSTHSLNSTIHGAVQGLTLA